MPVATNPLDNVSRAIPALFLYALTSAPILSTFTLDYVSRGTPAGFLYQNALVSGSLFTRALMGVGK